MKIQLKGSIAASLARLLGRKRGGRSWRRPVNLSGVWKLRLEKSRFTGGLVPKSIEVTVDHQEPQIRYSGTFVDPNGKPVPFEFDVVLDGKPRSSRGVAIWSERIDATTTRSESRPQDGRQVETTIIQISKNRRFLTIRRYVVGPEGTVGCTEVYTRSRVARPELLSGESTAPSGWTPRVPGSRPLGGLANAMAKIGLPSGPPRFRD